MTTPKKFVFVLMPFDEQFRNVYEFGIKAACKAAGAYCERVDEQLFTGTILERIYSQIAKADLIISEMTGRNANVFYETGYARALDKQVILLAQRREDIPFDTGHYPHIIYEGNIAALQKKLKKQVDVYLKQAVTASTPGVRKSRREFIEAFDQRVKDKRITSIDICGISLRDFLTEHGIMSGVWKSIRNRLIEEKKTSPQNRLRVRLLLLDPQSSEGFFRYKVEKPLAIGEHGEVQAVDITCAVNEIEQTIKTIYKGESQDFLEARLYDHCPFSFMFLTNTSVFVEQYYYRTHEEGALPTVKYEANSRQYEHLKASLEIIWKHAHRRPTTVGTATPVQVARIKNIYRVDKDKERERQQIESIRNAKTGTVDILSITGRFFSDRKWDAVEALADISSPEREKPVNVRLAILNPVCQPAIFRAIADGRPVNEIGKELQDYNWESHKESNLYEKVVKTTKDISKLIARGHSIDLRFYSCSTAHSLLITSDVAFVGTYIYGRSRKLDRKELKSEYPLIEYANIEPTTIDPTNVECSFDNTEQQVLRCTFEIVWLYYSIGYKEYKARIHPREEEEFNQNLARIREELGLVM